MTHKDSFPLLLATKNKFLSIKPTAILHHMTTDDLANYLIENDPAFKSRIEEAYAEYATSGRIIGHELTKRLERKREKEKAYNNI